MAIARLADREAWSRQTKVGRRYHVRGRGGLYVMQSCPNYLKCEDKRSMVNDDGEALMFLHVTSVRSLNSGRGALTSKE